MEALKGFYIHAAVFVLVNIGLFVINLLVVYRGNGPWWFYWPLIWLEKRAEGAEAHAKTRFRGPTLLKESKET